jgi:quercetin dioxygenase-like cupin family protein
VTPLKKTSFGWIHPLPLPNDPTPVEYLVFEKEGRKHQHHTYETFIVLDGFGTIVSGDIYHQVKPGDVVTIPPQTDHWMIPNSDHRLTGVLWYHTSPTRHSK